LRTRRVNRDEVRRLASSEHAAEIENLFEPAERPGG
jgi:hypothetical protein